MPLTSVSIFALAMFACGRCILATPAAAELRRWDSSTDCTGDYEVLNEDRMGECVSFLIPEPASILVKYLNETAYASYHYSGPMDCSGPSRHLADFAVNSCEGFDDYSQMRVWVTTPAPPRGTCEEPGECGQAYKACCLASGATGAPCKCDLYNGTGEAGSTDCGLCGQSFTTCCAGFKLRGFPCGCDVADKTASAIVI